MHLLHLNNSLYIGVQQDFILESVRYHTQSELNPSTFGAPCIGVILDSTESFKKGFPRLRELAARGGITQPMKRLFEVLCSKEKGERGLILKGFASFVVLDAVKCPFQIKEGGEREGGQC